MAPVAHVPRTRPRTPLAVLGTALLVLLWPLVRKLMVRGRGDDVDVRP